VLSLVWRVREGTPPDQQDMCRTRREYLDFVVDGRSLYNTLSVSGLVGWLAYWPEWINPPSIGELLPEGSSELQSVGIGSGQRLLYVCPECGDLQCGATTAVIIGEGDRIVWKDFAELFWDADGLVFETKGFEHIGPFYFDRRQYTDALRNPPPRPAS
jgi:hypothetical protein